LTNPSLTKPLCFGELFSDSKRECQNCMLAVACVKKKTEKEDVTCVCSTNSNYDIPRVAKKARKVKKTKKSPIFGMTGRKIDLG